MLLQAYIGRIPIEDNSLRQETLSMVEYASRMLSALEDYSTSASRNGHVAMHCLFLRRSLSICLWDHQDGVLNQIINVGQKTTETLKLHGISSFEHVLSASDKEIEKAAERCSPFANTLRAAVQKIVQRKFTLKSSLAYIEGPTMPPILVCQVECANKQAEKFAETDSPLTFTLLASTDRPGGCFFFRRDIKGPLAIKVAAPASFSNVTVCLIGSILGLDGMFGYLAVQHALVLCFSHSS